MALFTHKLVILKMREKVDSYMRWCIEFETSQCREDSPRYTSVCLVATSCSNVSSIECRSGCRFEAKQYRLEHAA